MKKNKIIKIVAFVLVILILPVTTLAQVDPGFNPNKLIEDTVFADTETFGGPAGIQSFLELKKSVLANTSNDFLLKLKEPSQVSVKQGLEDPQPNLTRLRTAAELIWDASRQSGLNPQVILVTLEKEQSLVTGRKTASESVLQKALDRAMGFDCPDSGGCGDLFPGFYYQIFGNFDSAGNRYLGAAKSLMRSYAVTAGRGPQINGVPAKVGQTVTIDNTQGPPYNAPASSMVTLANRATAALYRYTPHVFNGNYNFWRFFQDWFRYPNGTILSLAGDVKTYIIQNGSRLLLPDFVARARNLNIAGKIVVSPNELASYPQDKVLGPADNTIVKVGSMTQAYVFLENKAHPASELVLRQRSLNPNNFLNISQEEFALFETSTVLPPNDGTIVKGQAGAAIYLVDRGELKLFSAYTFKQRKVPASKVMTVPDMEVASYPKNGFVPPLDNTLIKASDSAAVYLVDQGLKKPLSAELFKNRGFNYKNVVSLAPDEVAGLTQGSYAAPKERTWFSVGSKNGQMYLFKEGAKHSISSYVKNQRKITPDYVFSEAEVLGWSDGPAVPPKDGTIVKGENSPAIYLVSKSQLRPMTEKAFKARRIKPANIVTLPQAEVDAYAKGEVLEK
ncbi:MAG: hypothetical protein JNN11_01865 [Candidatus Doudnabacteria bacterium]|nr:hypothetical protein [Candidatus Doudnabacteria bacterium]